MRAEKHNNKIIRYDQNEKQIHPSISGHLAAHSLHTVHRGNKHDSDYLICILSIPFSYLRNAHNALSHRFFFCLFILFFLFTMLLVKLIDNDEHEALQRHQTRGPTKVFFQHSLRMFDGFLIWWFVLYFRLHLQIGCRYCANAISVYWTTRECAVTRQFDKYLSMIQLLPCIKLFAMPLMSPPADMLGCNLSSISRNRVVRLCVCRKRNNVHDTPMNATNSTDLWNEEMEMEKKRKN